MAPAPSDRFPATWYPRVGDGTDVLPAPLLDRPYSATTEDVTPSHSPTGETVRHVTKGFAARDRLGRTRSEARSGEETIAGKTFELKSVFIHDPVSHCGFFWTQSMSDEELPAAERVAFVTCGPQTVRYKEMNGLASIIATVKDGTSTSGDTTTTIEHLVPLRIDGLIVNRVRAINTWLDEHAERKTRTNETWYSPELKELIRLGTEEDGYTGLTEIHRDNPEATLFYPPVGYRIEVAPPGQATDHSKSLALFAARRVR